MFLKRPPVTFWRYRSPSKKYDFSFLTFVIDERQRHIVAYTYTMFFFQVAQTHLKLDPTNLPVAHKGQNQLRDFIIISTVTIACGLRADGESCWEAMVNVSCYESVPLTLVCWFTSVCRYHVPGEATEMSRGTRCPTIWGHPKQNEDEKINITVWKLE